jgi:DNA-binding NarL/FixJ family response regulator
VTWRQIFESECEGIAAIEVQSGNGLHRLKLRLYTSRGFRRCNCVLRRDRMARESGPRVSKPCGRRCSLSTREYEILRMLTHGYDLPEIGERLGVSSKTVANHQSSIKQKLGASSALQLIIIARQMGPN